MKNLWVYDCKVMEKNAYLNEVAEIFHKLSADKPASIQIAEVVNYMLEITNKKYSKWKIFKIISSVLLNTNSPLPGSPSAPKAVFKLFNAQLKRFISTEFFDTFLDSLNGFLTDITGDQFSLILPNLGETLTVLNGCSNSIIDSKEIARLQKLLHDKCALIGSSAEGKTFRTVHSKWIGNTKPTAPAKKKEPETFVAITRDWQFDPKELTEHQLERMKERRDDIPALYNDNSVSQDSRSLQPWSPKQGAIRKSICPEAPKISNAVAPSTTTDGKAPASEFVAPDTESSRPRPETPQHKKKRNVAIELQRLTIDTVEGHNVFDDNKKTRNSRRHSLDVRMDTRTSPKKSTDTKEPKKVDKLTEKAKKRQSTSSMLEGLLTERGKSLATVPETSASESASQNTSVIREVTKATEVTKSAQKDNGKSKPEMTKQSSQDSSVSVIVQTNPVIKPEPISPEQQKVTAPQPTPAEPMDVQLMANEVSLGKDLNLVLESANNSENLSRSIVSSPELQDDEARESTFLNDTINISPILKEVAPAKETPVVTAPRPAESGKSNEILTTPKRSHELVAKENNTPSVISTTPHSFLSKMNGRGAQMLQQTKLFQESTPKEKSKEDVVPISQEDTLQRMLVNCKGIPPKSSPSTSILRRKRLEESMDDTESPAAKVRDFPIRR